MSAKDKQVELADFARIVAQYYLTYGNELQAKKDRLNGIIGAKHWPSFTLIAVPSWLCSRLINSIAAPAILFAARAPSSS